MKTKEKPFHIVSIGDMVVDVILSVPRLPVNAAEHQILNGLQLEPGGAGNFLIAGARLGMRMTALGAVGEDIFSKALLEMLEGEGVEVAGVLTQPSGSTTTVFVLEDNTRSHVFLGQYGQGNVVPLSYDWKQCIDNADAVQLWGYSLNESRLVECVQTVADYVKKTGEDRCF